MDPSANALDHKTDTTLSVLNQAEKDKWDVINGIRARERKVELFNDRRRWFGLGPVVLALAMSVLFPMIHGQLPLNLRCHRRDLAEDGNGCRCLLVLSSVRREFRCHE